MSLPQLRRQHWTSSRWLCSVKRTANVASWSAEAEHALAAVAHSAAKDAHCPAEDAQWSAEDAGGSTNGTVQCAKRRRQLRHLMIRIEPARLRQQPQPCCPDSLGLRADHRLRPAEGRAIGTDAYHRHPLGLIPFHLPLEPPSTCDELLLAQLSGSCRRARHEIRDPIAPLEQLPLLPRLEHARREPRGVQHGPKPIAGPSKVMASRARIQSRIDTAEQDAQPRRDHVRHRPTRGRNHLGARGMLGLFPYFYFFK